MNCMINGISLCVCFLVLASAAAAADLEQIHVWTGGEDGYAVYRIPAAVVTTKGTVVALCEGRASKADSGEIHLLSRGSTDGGKTFGPTQVVWKDGANTCGNPCAVVDQSTGTIWLLMTHNRGEDTEKTIVAGTAKESRTVWISHSADDGKTWAAPSEITKDVKKPDWAWFATGPGIGIQIEHGPHTGRLVIPCDYTYLHGKGRADPASGNSFVIYSDDHGKSWTIGGEAPGGGFNESQIVEISGGRLMLNMRNHRNGSTERGVCISDDGGATFKEVRHDPALIEPVCQGSIFSYSPPLAAGNEIPAASRGLNVVLFANPASETKRANMTVRLSGDDGQTRRSEKLVFGGPSAYSCLMQFPDGTIGLLYECGEQTANQRIDLARFSLDWLKNK